MRNSSALRWIGKLFLNEWQTQFIRALIGCVNIRYVEAQRWCGIYASNAWFYHMSMCFFFFWCRTQQYIERCYSSRAKKADNRLIIHCRHLSVMHQARNRHDMTEWFWQRPISLLAALFTRVLTRFCWWIHRLLNNRPLTYSPCISS